MINHMIDRARPGRALKFESGSGPDLSNLAIIFFSSKYEIYIYKREFIPSLINYYE